MSVKVNSTPSEEDQLSVQLIDKKLEDLDQLLNVQNSPTPTSGIEPYTGSWTKKQIVHLLKRTMFGAKKSDVDFFLTKTLVQSVDILITPLTAPPEPPLNNYTAAYGVADPDVPSGQTWVNAN